MRLIDVKNIVDADCRYVLSQKARTGDDNQIFINKNIANKLDWNWDNVTNNIFITKSNIENALRFSFVYDNKKLFHKGKAAILDDTWYASQKEIINNHFKENEICEYKIKSIKSSGNRHFINGLKQESGLNIQEFLIPKFSKLRFKKNENKIYLEIDQQQDNLRTFCYNVFKFIYKEFGSNFLKKYGEEIETKVGEFKYNGIKFPKYFNNSKLLGLFESEKIVQKISNQNELRFRYQKKPIDIDKLGLCYFTTEFAYNKSDSTHLLFTNFKSFIEDYSQNKFTIEKDNKGLYQLLFKNIPKRNMPVQKIFFGAPGTGKSHRIKMEFGNNLARITFHPELDYQGFIGAYKPSMNKDKISYRFIPEVFTRAYCNAWKSHDQFYLIIEEINRGNCAQIFGDIFQLLDRNAMGYSEYPIVCSPDLQLYLKNELDDMQRITEYEEISGVNDFSRMVLPNNLNILCTMNTSDQSLFPMDSAFKRRWDWEYIAIDYSDADKFNIDLEDLGEKINWGILIKSLNKKIKNHTQSEDKQIGNRFISPVNNIISLNEFVSKVVFYLWSEIFKEEQGSGDSIFFINKNEEITFNDFFSDGKADSKITRQFIEYNLDIKDSESNL